MNGYQDALEGASPSRDILVPEVKKKAASKRKSPISSAKQSKQKLVATPPDTTNGSCSTKATPDSKNVKQKKEKKSKKERFESFNKVGKKKPLIDEYGEMEDLNAIHDHDKDGGGGERPLGEDFQRFGSDDSDDLDLYTKKSPKKKHKDAPGRPYKLK